VAATTTEVEPSKKARAMDDPRPPFVRAPHLYQPTSMWLVGQLTGLSPSDEQTGNKHMATGLPTIVDSETKLRGTED